MSAAKFASMRGAMLPSFICSASPRVHLSWRHSDRFALCDAKRDVCAPCIPTSRPRGRATYARPRTGQRFVTASALPRDDILRRTEASGVPREIADRVLSKASAAIRDWSCVTTEFVTPVRQPVPGQIASASEGIALFARLACFFQWGRHRE